MPDPGMRNLTQAGLTQLAADVVLFSIVSGELVRDDVSVKENAINLLKYTIAEFKIVNN
jgi:hypothetical protein